MATKYFTNYAAKQYAQDVRAGRAATYASEKERQEREAEKQLQRDTAESAYDLYMKGAEKVAEHKLAKKSDGINLYQETPMPDQYGKGKLISRYLPTKTEMNVEGAGKLLSGGESNFGTYDEGAFDLYSEKDWEGIYKDVYSESVKGYDPKVPGQTSGYESYHEIWKKGGEDQMAILKHDMQIGAADKLNLQGKVRTEFLESEKFGKLGMEVGEKASKGLKVGEKLSASAQKLDKTLKLTDKASKFAKTAGKVGKTVGKVAGYGYGAYQAGSGIKKIQEGDTEEGTYETISGAAKVAGTYLMSVPEPTGLTKAAAAILVGGSSVADWAKSEGIF